MCYQEPCAKCKRCGACVAECYENYPVALTCPQKEAGMNEDPFLDKISAELGLLMGQKSAVELTKEVLSKRGWIEIAGHAFPFTLERLYATEYAQQGKHYPSPRKRKSKMRMSKQWRDR